MKRLEKKVAIITGGGTGIGEATAKLFAREGASVMICGRRLEPLQRVVDDINKNGGIAEALSVDVSDEDAVKNLVAATVEKYSKIDIVVNNAVRMVPGMLSNHKSRAWQQNFSVSLDGAMFLMREAYSQLEATQGSVVNVASVCGLLGSVGTAGYSAAKAGMMQLSRSAAIEWGDRQIRVNSVVPGVFLTPPTEALMPDDDSQRATASSIPLRRIGDPMECANAILFLASDEASYITGVALNVDGGRCAELNAGTASWD